MIYRQLINLKYHSFFKYIIVGGISYLFEILVIIVAKDMGVSSKIAVSVSFWLGLLVSFLMQKLITFQDKNLHTKILSKQLFFLGLLVLFNYLFTVILVDMLDKHLPTVLIRTIALILTTCWNYLTYKNLIFKHQS